MLAARRPRGGKGVGRPRRMQRAGEEGPNEDRRGDSCAERTRNMLSMDVTLDVSKLSGWLNAAADCRVAKSA